MLEKVQTAFDALTSIYDSLEALPASRELLNPSQGWSYPPISPSHVAWTALSLSRAIEGANFTSLSDSDNGIFTDLNVTLEYIRDNVLPNVPSNPAAGIQSIAIALSTLHAELAPLLSWTISEKTALPTTITRRLHQIQREVDNLLPEKDKLARDLKLIADTTEAAENIPTTLQELRANQAEMRELSSSASQIFGKIDELHKTATARVDASRALAEESELLLAKAAEAYRVTTTIGLAAAFDERARKLNASVYIWVFGLVLSLITLLTIGWIRLEDMRESFAASSFDSTRVWTQVALSALSIGAPVWFAWLSTKQIGQRFRLAEDYAFKASVSKAYEGYRREARDLSEEFSQSLFASALKRLDEAPLRLLDKPVPGSPVHEALNSGMVSKIIDSATGLAPRLSRKTEKTEPVRD